MATLLAYYKDRYIYYVSLPNSCQINVKSNFHTYLIFNAILLQDGIFGESKEAKVVHSEPENWWKKPEDVEDESHFIYGVNQTGSTVVRKRYL